MFSDTLPDELKRLVQNHNWTAATEGKSSAQTFRLDGPERLFLKIDNPEPAGGLQREAEALRWLRQYLPAPEVLYFDRVGSRDFLLMRAVPGQPASAECWQQHPTRLAETLGHTLRTLHAIDPASCPFDASTETRLRDVAIRVEHGLVDVEDFDDENMGLSPQEILHQLHTQKPFAQDDRVVTHGDFCPDNLLLANWTLSGFIDLGRLGVGDRYADLALCERSLRHLFDTDRYSGHFFRAYGLDTVDLDKLRYFRLLDELN
ncbi:APH(3') family aminoglycoside O-phosphotransferase [Rudanella paleaurantiibacter]|uniref:Aminoglycoside 3'-phosphotransferase n=1 Tax=Rudanella paleaurantiibacter TaxID=2614655 RepID=A0A7J5TV88_9BACT|nr:APH(3') family aminoglycoside O-phosphotransferase [Rudanella paleaurantiibacter]KAB7727987.1 APH(3') family aminoglycoside O-phosphotransferase [Rudanella paleaurantiibacter]